METSGVDPGEEESSSAGEPVDLAIEMLNGGFSKPVVIDALVAKGLDREVARDIVTSLLKARYRRGELERIAIRRTRSRWLMVLGGGIFLLFSWFTLESFQRAAQQAGGGGFRIHWGPICAGFFIFLYGFSQRKSF